MEDRTLLTATDVKREAVRQSEKYIETQLKLAVASDQRAVQFCAALGITITIAANAEASTAAVAALHITALITLAIAAIMSAYSLRPVSINGPGGHATPFLKFSDCPAKLLDAMARRNDEKIRENEAAVAANSKVFRRAMKVGLIGIFFLVFRLWISLGFHFSEAP